MGALTVEELPGCQPQSSWVQRDDELMQSLSSMSFASDPFPILAHTLLTLHFLFSLSYPSHTVISLSPTFFLSLLPFSITLLSCPPPTIQTHPTPTSFVCVGLLSLSLSFFLSLICFVLQLPGNEKGTQLLRSWNH